MHRIVRRVSLGSVAYSVDVAQTEELSGPDTDSGEPLRFLTDDGLTIYWGPPQ